MYNDGKMLEGIFSKQRILIDEYIMRGMIPVPPIVDNIEKKEYQAYLKKIISWITDELVEASIEAEELKNQMLLHSPNYSSIPKFIDELMDVFSFVVELMIYSDIDTVDIYAYYQALLKERDLPILFSDGLSTSMAYGRHTNIWDDQVRITSYHAETLEIPELRDQTYSVKVSEELYILQELCMWDTAKAFSKAGKYLTFKDWKTEIEPMNVLEYKRQLMIGWLYFMKLLDLIGLEPRIVYHYFIRTNNKNLSRLQNGY